jgi:hypothetical protein
MSEAERLEPATEREGALRRGDPAAASPEAVAGAVEMFRRLIAERHPETLTGIHRVEGGLREDPPAHGDVDLAVVFSDAGWPRAERLLELGELAFDVLMACDVWIHGHPLSCPRSVR